MTLWGETFKDGRLPGEGDLGQPGRIANPVDGPGELTVPTVFSTAENDFTSPPGPIIVNFNNTRQAGTPTELYVSRERNLGWARFMRIPGIDQDEARQIYFSLVATGVWNGNGERVVANVEEAAARAQAVSLPSLRCGAAQRDREPGRNHARGPRLLGRVRAPGRDVLQPLRAAPVGGDR